MEEQQSAGLLQQIRPPRLEDAGLEDCALPPDSIQEAFLKAATAVKSRAASIFSAEADDEDEDCLQDPWPVVDGEVEVNPPGACGGEKGGPVEVGGDKVVVGSEEEKGDKVIVGGDYVGEAGGGEQPCVDGLAGLEIGDKKKNKNGDEEKKGPILVGGYA